MVSGEGEGGGAGGSDEVRRQVRIGGVIWWSCNREESEGQVNLATTRTGPRLAAAHVRLDEECRVLEHRVEQVERAQQRCQVGQMRCNLIIRAHVSTRRHCEERTLPFDAPE